MIRCLFVALMFALCALCVRPVSACAAPQTPEAVLTQIQRSIDEADLPQRIADAIKEAYDQVKIKTITFANYMDEQVYHVILSEPAGEDKTEQFYVRADGTIVPYTAQENN